MSNHTDMQDKYCGDCYDIYPIQSQHNGNHKRGVASTGRNPYKRPANLFPVTALESESDLVSSPAQLADAVKEEFERRWHAMPDDLKPSFTSCDVPPS